MIVRESKLNNTANRSKRFHLLFAGIILFRLSLVLAFYGFVLKYYPDDYHSVFKPITFVFTYTLFIISALFTVKMVKKRAECMSGQLFLLVYMFSYVPTSVLCTYMWDDNLYGFVVSLFWIFIMFLLSLGKPKRNKRSVELLRSSYKLPGYLFIIAVVMAIAFTLLIIYSFNKFQFTFSFDSLYEIRHETKESITTLQGLVIFCMASVCTPILIGVFLKKKNIIWLVAISILQILLFMVGGDKFYLFQLIIGLLLAIFYKKKYIFAIPNIFAIVIALSTLFTLVTEGTFFETWIFDLCVRRVLFTPAHLSYYYYDFCKVYPKVMFTDHQVISRVLVKLMHVETPYDSVPIADVLGLHYWNETGKSNGGFGSAFSQVGYMCLIIYPVMFLCIGNIFDGMTRNLDACIYMPLVCSLTVYLLDYSISGIELTYILIGFILFTLARGYLYKYKQPQRRISTLCVKRL